jgi:hypothetical protein
MDVIEKGVSENLSKLELKINVNLFFHIVNIILE